MYGNPEESGQAASPNDQGALSIKGKGGKGKYWALYSGLFVLLKQKILVTDNVLQGIIHAVQQAFAWLALGDVRIPV
jgi:hypothetical protein